MPVLLDADGLASWLAAPEGGDDDTETKPSPSVSPAGSSAAAAAPALSVLKSLLPIDEIHWHPTTKKMGKLDYQESDTASPVKLPSQQQRSVASFFSKKTPPPAEAPASSANPSSSSAAKLEEPPAKRVKAEGTDALQLEMLAQVTSMGFDAAQARSALERAKWTVEAAVGLLLG